MAATQPKQRCHQNAQSLQGHASRTVASTFCRSTGNFIWQASHLLGDGHRTPVASADSAKLVNLHQASIDPLQHIRDQLKANQVLWDGAHCLQGSLGNALSELALGRNCVGMAKSILTVLFFLGNHSARIWKVQAPTCTKDAPGVSRWCQTQRPVMSYIHVQPGKNSSAQECL